MDVNKGQKIDRLPGVTGFIGFVTPVIYFCIFGNLRVVRLLFMIGGYCTQVRQCLSENYFFPMLVAAKHGHLDICKWLFEYGGDAKYQINKETIVGATPLWC